MAGRYFVLLWWHLGGGRAVITLRATDRDRGRWSCEVIVEVTCCHFILSLHSAGGGTWVMTGYCDNVWDLLTSVNDPNHCIRMTYVDHPDVLCNPSRCYVYKCRLIFLEVVWKSVPCVLYRKIRMRVTRMTMRAMCHCKMRATCSRREGSLQCPFFNLPILPEQNGRVKK